jgi:hypothetical protein
MNADHIKFMVDLVQVLLVEYASQMKRKVSGSHSVAKTVAQISERLFPEKNSANKSWPTKRCAVL